jgi:hypothetical protein
MHFIHNSPISTLHYSFVNFVIKHVDPWVWNPSTIVSAAESTMSQPENISVQKISK